MRESFSRIIHGTSEKPEARLLEARELFDVYKRGIDRGEKTFGVSDLMLLHDAFGANPVFEKDREWIRGKFAGEFREYDFTRQASVIKYLADNDVPLARRLFAENEERFQDRYRNSMRSLNNRDASRESYDEAVRIRQVFGGVIDAIALPGRAEEMEDKIGYEHFLDTTLKDSHYKEYKVRISRLRAPELLDVADASVEVQWNGVLKFLKRVEAPAVFLKSWYGTGIDERKNFLAETVNGAFRTGIELVKQMPRKDAGMRLSELCDSADAFSRLLDRRYSAGGAKNSISFPLESIDNPEILNAFFRERGKREALERERRARAQKRSGKEKEKEEEEEKEFVIGLEYHLARAGIERGAPDFVREETERIGKRMGELNTADIDTLYGALEKRAGSDERCAPFAGEFLTRYRDYLRARLPHCESSDERKLIEARLADFFAPSQNWDDVVGIVEAIKKSNAPKQYGGRTKYFPERLIDTCAQSIAALPENRRAERLALLEEFCSTPLADANYRYESIEQFMFWAETLNRHGLRKEAAQYAATQNLERSIAQMLADGDDAAAEVLWTTKGWEPAGVFSDMVYKIRERESSALFPALNLAARYYDSYGRVGRERQAAQDAEKIEEKLRSLLERKKEYRREYIPDFSEEETAAIREQIGRCRSFLWELWQAGRIPQDAGIRGRILKIFVEDGRDLAIAELGLSAQQKIELFIAVGKAAAERKDYTALQHALDDAKRLAAYQESEEARTRVAELEKERDMLALRTNVAKAGSEHLRALLDRTSGGDKDAVFRVLIESGRYHDAVAFCGALGYEKIARELIRAGALDSAEELIRTAPDAVLPNRKTLAAFLAYKKAGGEDISENDTQMREVVSSLPALLRARGASEEEIFAAMRDVLPDDRRFIIERCSAIAGREAFWKTNPSYEKYALERFYIDALFDHGRNQEAIRFAVLHENGALVHCIRRMAEAGLAREIEPMLYKIIDLKTALEVSEILTGAGRKETAESFVKRFVGSLTDESPVFKNIWKVRYGGGSSFINEASGQSEEIEVANLKKLIFTAGAAESLAHIRSLFKKDENIKRFVVPLFEGFGEAEVSPREFELFLSALGQDGMKWYANFLTERNVLKDMDRFIAATERIISRNEAMKRYPHLYASYVAACAREGVVEDMRNYSSQERVRTFVERYNAETAKDTALLASVILDKQEWNKFVALLPVGERERAVLLADWYSSPRTEEQDLGSVIERAASRLAAAAESGDVETLRLSLNTLLGARTPEAASKLTKVFLRHLESGGSIGTTYRLAKTLSEMDNFKANTVLADIMANPGTPEIFSRYIIRLLVENGHFDADLKGYFEEKRTADQPDNGKRLINAVSRFRMLMQKYGINPDSSIMRYTDARSSEEVSSDIERMIEQVRGFEEQGGYQELGLQLMADLNMRLLYFLRNGGRAKFSLINDYNFGKFTHVLQMGNGLELHAAPLETFEQAVRQANDSEEAARIIRQILSGRFPFESGTDAAVFDCAVDANSESQMEQARVLVGATFGRSEFGAFARAIMYRSFLDALPAGRKPEEAETLWQNAGRDFGSLSAFLQYCEAIFGPELENARTPAFIEKHSSDDLPLREGIREETPDVNAVKAETALAALGKKLTDAARKAAQQNKISKEERDRLAEQYQNPDAVLPSLFAGGLPQSFAPALSEWQSHIQAALQAAREARVMRRGESQARQLQLRYLDKTRDLPEYLRFADSAMCCFTSKNFEMVGAQQYVARIWKDPLSFVFHVEEPSADRTDRRNSVGFVFGSYGTNREGEPVLILNGVYMDKKTNLAAKKVMQVIEEQLAKPLGCKEILVASQHAGRSNYGAEYENTGREYLRLRAIKQQWGNEPEQHTYDDIGLVAVDAQAERAQDFQAVNRWAKTGNHILRKQVL